jgi:hypothetical protein
MLQQLFLDMARALVSSPHVQTFLIVYTTGSVGLRLASDVQSAAALAHEVVRRALELRAQNAVPAVLQAPAAPDELGAPAAPHELGAPAAPAGAAAAVLAAPAVPDGGLGKRNNSENTNQKKQRKRKKG